MSATLKIAYMVSGLHIDQPYIGSAIEITPTTCRYREMDLPDCLDIKYSASLPICVDPADQKLINRIIAEYGDPPLQFLALLVVHPFDFVGYRASLDEVEVRLNPPPEPVPGNLYNRHYHDLIWR